MRIGLINCVRSPITQQDADGAALTRRESATAATLAAKERAARVTMYRLRDAGRELERLLASSRIMRCGHRAECTHDLVLEAADIRAELRSWDVRSPEWLEALNSRLEHLTEEIQLTAEMGSPAPPVIQPSRRMRPVPRRRRPSVQDIAPSVSKPMYPRSTRTTAG